jgi:hypothetical protein
MLLEEDIERIASIVKGQDAWLLADKLYGSVTICDHGHIGAMSSLGSSAPDNHGQDFSEGCCLQDYRAGYVIAQNARIGEAFAALSNGEASRQTMESTLRSGNRVRWVSPRGGPHLYVLAALRGMSPAHC